MYDFDGQIQTLWSTTTTPAIWSVSGTLATREKFFTRIWRIWFSNAGILFEKVFFLKNGPISASFSFIFVLFSFQHYYNANWKKHKGCALDSNPGPQNGSQWRNHGANVLLKRSNGLFWSPDYHFSQSFCMIIARNIISCNSYNYSTIVIYNTIVISDKKCARKSLSQQRPKPVRNFMPFGSSNWVIKYFNFMKNI